MILIRISITTDITKDKGCKMLVFNSDVKTLMGKLLREETFDFFEVRGVEVVSLTRFEISGVLNKEFATEKETERNFCTWGELKPIVFSLVKGKVQPRHMKIVFSFPSEKVASLHENASAYFLNMHFENGDVMFTTASQEKVFKMDKSLDTCWDEFVKKFFGQNGLNLKEID